MISKIMSSCFTSGEFNLYTKMLHCSIISFLQLSEKSFLFAVFVFNNDLNLLNSFVLAEKREFFLKTYLQLKFWAFKGPFSNKTCKTVFTENC